MDTVCEDDLCWLQLDDFRMLLIKTIDPSRITPYLRQCQVVSAEDEEQLFNDPNLVIRRRKVGALLDILQRTGLKGYTAFLESLELDYPQLYSRITGKEPNKTFSILIAAANSCCSSSKCPHTSAHTDTAGETGLTQFLMSELSRLQRALQDERKRRQQACSVAKEQEAWSRQQQLKDRELRKLTERVQKIRDERERLSKEVKQLRDHNYSLMVDINSLNQEKSSALLANRDLQIEVERLKHTVLRAENQTRLLRRRTLRPMQEISVLPKDPFFHPNRPEEQKEEVAEEKEEDTKQEDTKQEKQDNKPKEVQQLQHSPAPPPMNLLTTVFRLRRDLHRAEEQRARSVEEKEELELCCAQLKGETKMYCQQNKQTLRQLEEVIKERDKALASQVQQQEEVRLHLQEKDQYRERVRQLTEQSDKLELFLLRSQGEELKLRTRLRKITCNSQHCERSGSSEEEEQPRDPENKGSSEEVPSGMLGENEEMVAQQQQQQQQNSVHVEGAGESEHGPSSCASWDKQLDLNLISHSNFGYRRKRALRSKLNRTEFATTNLDDSSISDITESD